MKEILNMSDVLNHVASKIDDNIQKNSIIRDVTQSRTIIIHGTFFNDCEICDNEITESNPGKEITYTENGKKYMVFVCNDCYRDPDYLEIMSKKENMKIKNFEL